MDFVATIQPMGNQPGLSAFACAKCGYTHSRFIAPPEENAPQ
jgi:hypothetical protein